jgi:hypothetical protein
MMMGGSRDAAKRPAAVADQQKANDPAAQANRINIAMATATRRPVD